MDERPTARYVTASDGVSLAFLTSGVGPLDILWLPGVPYPLDLLHDDPSFQRFARRLHGFSRTIEFEGRGVGASGGNPLDQFRHSYALDDLAAVLDASGSERGAVVGCGTVTGTQAIQFAARYPDRVSALILIDSHAHYVRGPDHPIGVRREHLSAFFQVMKANWGTGANVEVLAPSKSADQDFRQRLARCERLGLSPEDTAENVRTAFELDLRDVLSDIRVSTLVLHRKDDRFVRVEAGRYLAEHIPGARYVELEGSDYLFFVGDTDALLGEIEEFLTGSRQPVGGDVVTLTILFTDIVASTERAARMGHGKWTRICDEHDAMVRATLKRHKGHEVKTVGDGFLATFDSTTRAVKGAAEIVTAARGLDLEVRAGVHLGDVEVRPNDVVGLPVTIAKRICDLAGPGEVLVSRPVVELAAGSGLEFSERGEHDLKGVPGSWNLFGVRDMIS